LFVHKSFSPTVCAIEPITVETILFDPKIEMQEQVELFTLNHHHLPSTTPQVSSPSLTAV
jgi:hypothetical protein